MSTKNVLKVTNEEGRTYEFQKPTKADYREAVKFWELYNDFLDRNPTYSQKEAIRIQMQEIKGGFSGKVLPFISADYIKDAISNLEIYVSNTYLDKFGIFNGLFRRSNRLTCPWDDHESGITCDGINGLEKPGLYVITTFKGFKVPVLRTGRFEFIVCCSGGTLLGYPVYNPSYQFGSYATYIGRKEEAKEIEFVKPLSELEGLSYEEIFEGACRVYDCTSFYKQRTAIFTRIYW